MESHQNVFSHTKIKNTYIYQSCYKTAKIVCISYTSHLATHFCLQHNVRRYAKGDCKRKTKSILLNQKVYFKIDKKLKNKNANFINKLDFMKTLFTENTQRTLPLKLFTDVNEPTSPPPANFPLV